MLADASRTLLLMMARASIAAGVSGQAIQRPELASLPEELRAEGACFVTLTKLGALRGCIGSLEARQPLAADVCEHALDAALQDYRFSPVTAAELDSIHIEISVLTHPEPLAYQTPEDLLRALRPGVDGVILAQGRRRATFLPQVWDQLPEAPVFLSQLCEKMGAEPSLWRSSHLDVFTYQVECFEESENPRQV
jgi:AmmeMemoRadiSam system protein A